MQGASSYLGYSVACRVLIMKAKWPLQSILHRIPCRLLPSCLPGQVELHASWVNSSRPGVRSGVDDQAAAQ
jgi:hypothetical protein